MRRQPIGFYEPWFPLKAFSPILFYFILLFLRPRIIPSTCPPLHVPLEVCETCLGRCPVCDYLSLAGAMIFTHRLDPRLQRRHRVPLKTGKRSVQLSTVDLSFFDDASCIGRAALLSDGLITNLWHPAAIATTQQGIASEKKLDLYNSRDAGWPLPPYRVGLDSTFGYVGDANAQIQSGDAVLSAAATEMPLPAAGPRGRQQQQQQQQGEKGGSWSEELLGYGARVLALSVHSQK